MVVIINGDDFGKSYEYLTLTDGDRSREDSVEESIFMDWRLASSRPSRATRAMTWSIGTLVVPSGNYKESGKFDFNIRQAYNYLP